MVAVVDTGLDVGHPDLAANVWRNGGETVNGADDDGDGLVDDVSGWSFGRASGDVADATGHGTHVAGLVGARGGNGLASAGMCWSCTILPVDVYRPGGRATLADLANGMEYAASRARIVNLSLESPIGSEAVAATIARHPDRLFVVSAGNGGRDLEAAPSYPCSIGGPNVLCVAADDDGALAEGSNWGARSVHLAAPGVALVSTAPGGGTSAMTGSSFAAPLVAGTAALLWSWRPDASVEEVRAAILAGADRLPGWSGLSASGARLNAFGALRALAAARGERLAAEAAPVSTSAASRGAAALAVPLRVRSARRALLVRLACRSQAPCTGVLRVAGRRRPFALAAGEVTTLRLRARARRSVLVAVVAGGRSRVQRLRVAR